MVRSHSGALDMGDNHAEGSCDPELEVLNSKIVGPEVRTVGIEKLDLKEGEIEEPLAIVVNLSYHHHALRMWADPDGPDQETLADIDELRVTKGVLG